MSGDLQIAGILLWPSQEIEIVHASAWHGIPKEISPVALKTVRDESLFQARIKNQLFDDFEEAGTGIKKLSSESSALFT
jgi:hypothetical protein